MALYFLNNIYQDVYKRQFLDGEKVSEETIESLKMKEGYHFSFILKVDENSSHVGGMNLFGKHFGDHPQDIIMKVDYAAG